MEERICRSLIFSAARLARLTLHPSVSDLPNANQATQRPGWPDLKRECFESQTCSRSRRLEAADEVTVKAVPAVEEGLELF
jgi:hypothetical protein